MNEDMNRLPIPQAIVDITESMVAEALVQVEIAENFRIENDADAQLAAEQLRGIAKFRKGFDQRRLDSTAPYRQLTTDINDAFNEPLAKAKRAEDILRGSLSIYTQEQQRLAEERRKAEEARIAEERRKVEEAAEKERERLASLKTEAAREKSADKIEALETKVAELEVTAPVVAAPAKLAGFGLRDNWQAVYNSDALQQLVAAAAGVPVSQVKPDLLVYLQINEKQVGSVVKALKQHTNIPGVRAVNNKTTAVR